MPSPTKQCSLVGAMGALIAIFAVVPAAGLDLATFNNSTFGWRWGGFTDTPGPTSVHLQDLSDGWGGAGINISGQDLSPYANEYFTIDLIPQAGNGVTHFDLELIEDNSGGQTNKSGKWRFDISGLTPGVPVTLQSTTTLANPTFGIGDFQNLNLAQPQSWQVLGQNGSPGPFDIKFDNIGVTGSFVPPPYPGAEPDAPWRTVAASQIDSIRKADLNVTVVDAVGTPVPGAAIAVQMQGHEFGFGSAVKASHLRDNNPQYVQYKAKVDELFNIATIENNLKWEPWEGEWGPNFTQAGLASALQWLDTHEIEGRGHVMVWPGNGHLPSDIEALIDGNPLTPTEQQYIRDRISQHITEVGTATQGLVGGWDVINETRTNHDLMDLLDEGDQAMVDWFNLAAGAITGADFYINDFGILSSGGNTNSSNQNTYYNTIQQLINDGAPIDGIGFQGHFNENNITGPEQLWTILDRFEMLSLKMQVTEFDFNTTDEALQAQYVHDFLTAVFAHEGISDIIHWGFWEDAHWRPDAAMYRSDWSVKPNGQAYLDLVFDEWWTEEFITVDAQGETLVRGFKGDYLVTASTLGGVAQVNANLTGSQTNLVVTLPMLVGDYNGDGVVDSGDYTVWRDDQGSTTNLAADGDNNGVVDLADYFLWLQNFGAVLPPPSSATAVPEPSSFGILLYTLLLVLGSRNNSRS